MYLADYHVHSRISPDGGDSMTALAEAAVEAGLDELCFTDHVEPIVWASTDLRGPYDWSALTAEFEAAQVAMGDRIKLRLGIELGDACWNFAHTEKLLADAPPFDFIIGSVHMLSKRYQGLDLYYFDPKTEEEAYDGIADYLGRVKVMVEWGKFDVLGHLTLPLRYLNENRGWNLSMERFGGEITDIFSILKRKEIGLELNTNRGGTPLPDGIWRWTPSSPWAPTLTPPNLWAAPSGSGRRFCGTAALRAFAPLRGGSPSDTRCNGKEQICGRKSY